MTDRGQDTPMTHQPQTPSALADDTPVLDAAFVAQCSACPVFVAAPTVGSALPLMDQHTDDSGHRLWATSNLARRET